MCISEATIVPTPFEVHYRRNAGEKAVLAKNLIHDKTEMMLFVIVNRNIYHPIFR